MILFIFRCRVWSSYDYNRWKANQTSDLGYCMKKNKQKKSLVVTLILFFFSRLGKKLSAQSRGLTIEAQLVHCLCMILQEETLSTI